MSEDLKILVGAPGAKEAAKDLQGVAAAEVQVAGAAGAAGPAVSEAGKKAAGGLDETRQAARQLASVVGDLGVQIPGLQRILYALTTSGLTPMTAAFIGAGLALEGIKYAFAASEEAERKEQERLTRLGAACLTLAENLEKVARARRMTQGAVVREAQAAMAVSGLGEGEIEALAPEAAKRHLDLAQAAAAFQAPGVPEKARKDMKTFGRWFQRQSPEARAALAAAGTEAARAMPTASVRMAEAGAAERGPGFEAAAFEKEYAAEYDLTIGEAREQIRAAGAPKLSDIWWSGNWVPWKMTRRGVPRERLREMAVSRPPGAIEEGWNPLPGSGPVTVNYGVYYAGPDSDPAGEIPRNGMR